MNILLVTPFPPSEKKGGIPYIVLRLSQNLVQKGHTVTVVAPTSRNIWEDHGRLKILGVRSFRLPKWPYHSLGSFSVPYSFPSLVSLMKRMIYKHNIDVVHAHGQKYLSTWVAINLASRARLPSVLTIHGTYGLKYYDPFASAIEEAINKTVLKDVFEKSSAITCSTQIELNYVKRYVRDVKWFQIFNGIDVMRFYNASKYKMRNREEYQIPSDKKVILFAGRLVHVKGLTELMKAVESVTDAFPEAYFLVVGDGPLRKEVEDFANANEGKMKFFSWVPYSEMHKLYALSDIFVLPSRSEGLPLSIMEAMASRLHVVTTPVGGIPEILVEYQHKTYINQVSSVAISSSILKALKTISTEGTIDLRTLSFVKKFDLPNITVEVEKVYRDVVG